MQTFISAIISCCAGLIAVTSLVGCEPDIQPPKTGIDQCLRAELFKECMGRVPTGPTHVVSNDWAEVIDECEDSSAMQSYRLLETIKPECRDR